MRTPNSPLMLVFYIAMAVIAVVVLFKLLDVLLAA